MHPGEALHKAGEDGARRARTWLESTTRVKTVWLNTEGRHAARMTFKWPHNPEPFSFDLGGLFHEGDIDGDHFGVEVKSYKNNKNHQDSEYRSYLAKCYVVQLVAPAMYDHFLWITWHPFSINNWSQLKTVEYIQRGILEESQRVLGCDSESGRDKIDHDAVQEVSKKLWTPIVLCEEQEQLIITPENRRLVYGQAAKEGSL